MEPLDLESSLQKTEDSEIRQMNPQRKKQMLENMEHPTRQLA
jgi:hypothetical protein